MFIISVYDHDDNQLIVEGFWTLREAVQRAMHADNYQYEWMINSTDAEGCHMVGPEDIAEYM